jgi:hypothetical protein
MLMAEPRRTKGVALSRRRVHLSDADVEVLRALVRRFAGVCRSSDVQLELAHIDEQLSHAAVARPRRAPRPG